MKTLLVWVGPNTTPDVAALVSHFDCAILFEPGRDEYLELCNQFPKQEGVEIVNAGCGLDVGDFEFTHYNHGLSSSFARVTDDARKAWAHADWSGERTTIARMVNLGDWLRTRGIETIHKLVIDAQGFDLDILRTIQSPYLEKQFVKELVVEGDIHTFNHYEHRNSFTDQAELLQRCGYVCTRKLGTIHIDSTWEPEGNANQIAARLERQGCRTYY
jgi:FkbM family methyltransferase